MNVAVTAAAAQHQRIINAQLAYGGIVLIEPDEFRTLVARMESPLVVHAEQGWWKTVYISMTNYKGLFFVARSEQEIFFGPEVETIKVKSIAIPTF